MAILGSSRILSFATALLAAVSVFVSTAAILAQPPAGMAQQAAPVVPVDAQQQELTRRLATVFDQAVKEHTAATEALAWLKPGEWSTDDSEAGKSDFAKHPYFCSWSLRFAPGPVPCRSKSLEEFVRTPLGKRGNLIATSIVGIAAGYLNHNDPRYRAVACEILAHFPIHAIDGGFLSTIARRLDDRTKAFDGVVNGLGQRVSIGRARDGVSVANFAAAALEHATGFQFPNTAAFDTWWRANRNYGHRLWYWAMRWENLPWEPAPSKTHRENGPTRVAMEVDLPVLVATVGPEESLKTLLLASNDAVAIQAGVVSGYLHDEEHPADTPTWWGGFQMHVKPESVARFADRFALKPRLVWLLKQEQPWPEVASANSKRVLLRDIIEVLKITAAQTDAPAIEWAIMHPTTTLAADSTMQSQLVLLLAALAPERAEPILLARFRQEPKERVWAAALVHATGLKHWNELAPALADDNVRSMVLPNLGRLQTPQAAKVLGALLSREQLTGAELETEIDRKGIASGMREELFEAYVDAAVLFNSNQPVIGKDLLDRSLCVGGKGGPSEAAIQHNKQVPAARAEAIRKLSGFFRHAAEPVR